MIELKRFSGKLTEVFLGCDCMGKALSRSSEETDRIIQMAWEDRTPFDAILVQFGLTPGEVIKMMRAELKPNSFRLWRVRTMGRRTKHFALRGYAAGRFRSANQKGG